MKWSKIVLLAMVFSIMTVGTALAGTQVQTNQSTDFSASVKNTTRNSVRAAVKLFGYDDAGMVIGHLCQEAWLGAGRTTSVKFAWQAPAYATGVYWSPKVDVNGTCPNISSDDDHDDDDDDDDDHDDDREYHDHHNHH